MSTDEALRRAIIALRRDGGEREAVKTLTMIHEQCGCEHFDPAVKDGRLVTLIDVIVFG